MNELWLAGRALACALGPDVGHAVAALRHGGVAPARFEVPGGFGWPYFALPSDHGDWLERTCRIVRRVARESGALDTPRRGPLFLASSSIDLGEREVSGDFERDFHTFAETLAGALDWQGPVFTVSTACTSAHNAVLSAGAWLRGGDADEALVLGLELANRLTVAGFGSMQLLAPDAALPLGASRRGLVLGEAVAALRLTSSRGTARWRVAGGANVVDGRDPAGAVPSAVEAMCREALRNSGLTPAQVGLVKLQAAGSPANDASEIDGLRRVFGSSLPPLVSLKAAIGHTLGASGAAELTLLTACLETGAWPSSVHAPDPALGAELAKQAPPDARYVLANILGFGGGHAALVLEDRGGAPA
jgi:3-oxoacyl-[acyl-carrier-protein] synthase-1